MVCYLKYRWLCFLLISKTAILTQNQHWEELGPINRLLENSESIKGSGSITQDTGELACQGPLENDADRTIMVNMAVPKTHWIRTTLTSIVKWWAHCQDRVCILKRVSSITTAYLNPEAPTTSHLFRNSWCYGIITCYLPNVTPGKHHVKEALA